MADNPDIPYCSVLTSEERRGIILAVQSTMRRLRNCYQDVVPIIQSYGFLPPSPSIMGRDLSEKIERAIIQHCHSFDKGEGHADLTRGGERWEVKVAKGRTLHINQCTAINSENYIIAEYDKGLRLRKIWVLHEARDSFFSPKSKNSNARWLRLTKASDHIEELYNVKDNNMPGEALTEVGNAREPSQECE